MAEKIAVLIDGKRFRDWENININLSLDSIDSFDFGTPFVVDNFDFRKTFLPATFPFIQIRLNDEPILNGILISKSTAMAEKSISLGGYSLPGRLNDLPVPSDKYPLEFVNQDLARIAATLASYYDVESQVLGVAGAVFDPPVSPEPAEKILAFLIKLAKKRSFLVSNSLSGKLTFFVPGSSSVVTPLKQGEPPLVDAKVDYDEQNMFSSVTGLGASNFGRDPESFTVPITVLQGINRPFVYAVSESQGAELQATVKFKAGRLFSNSIKISVEVVGWRGINKKIWTPGDFITLLAPNCYFFNETKLMIRSVSFSRDASSETASLELVFPGVYSGEFPERLPWS